MKTIFGAIAISTALILSTEAEANFTGMDLLQGCTGSIRAARASCGAWVAGFEAGLFAAHEGEKANKSVCIPEGFTGKQAVLIVEKYVKVVKAETFPMRAAASSSRSADWSPSGATQQHVRNRGISGSARLALETTLMTWNGHGVCVAIETRLIFGESNPGLDRDTSHRGSIISAVGGSLRMMTVYGQHPDKAPNCILFGLARRSKTPSNILD